MMTIRRAAAWIGAAGLVGAAAVYAQPGDKDGAHGQPDMQKQMQDWMNKMKPGKQHEMLAKAAGTWDCTIKMWMGGPGQPPSESKGKATFKMVLGGRYQQQEFSGKMSMGPEMEMDFSGMGLTGYDNGRNLYVGTWADTMGTGLSTMSGGQSPDGKVITMFGTMDEPMTGEIGKTVKYVTRMVDDKTMVFEAWEVMYGSDFKAFEITYTRAK